jgi:hypothetical protein
LIDEHLHNARRERLLKAGVGPKIDREGQEVLGPQRPPAGGHRHDLQIGLAFAESHNRLDAFHLLVEKLDEDEITAHNL